MSEGTLVLGVRGLGTALNVSHTVSCPEIGPSCAVRDEPAQVHDQRLVIAELRALAELSVRDWLALELQLPVRVAATTITYRLADGTPFTPDVPDLHHRDEVLVGPGDPWLLSRLRWRAGRFAASLALGLTLPLGRVEQNPFALGRAGFEHQHLQFGAGTVNALSGVDVQVAWSRVTARASAFTQLSLAENLHGFQAGSRLALSAGADVRVLDALVVGLSVDNLTEWPERWDGVVEQDGNLGRSDVLLGAQVAWALGATTLRVSVRVPVFQYFFVAEHGQLSYPAIVTLGVERRFDLLGAVTPSERR